MLPIYITNIIVAFRGLFLYFFINSFYTLDQVLDQHDKIQHNFEFNMYLFLYKIFSFQEVAADGLRHHVRHGETGSSEEVGSDVAVTSQFPVRTFVLLRH